LKKKKKPKSRVHRWLMKNSIVYRSGRKFVKSKFGLVLVSLAVILAIIFLSFHLINVYNIRNILRGFEHALKDGNEDKALTFLDMSADNPYRLTFPDVVSLIRDDVYFTYQIEKIRFSQRYRWGEMETAVETFDGQNPIDSFQGRILFSKQEKRLFRWKIAGVESY
jgi:hypothetical protein